MRIAFTSCFDATEDPDQRVWTDILRHHQPEGLLLLGDSIYMDYFPHLGAPKAYSDEKFAAEMHDRYRRQWEVASFRELVRSVQHVGVIWDDHDFAWNGSCGAANTKKSSWNSETMRWEITETGKAQPHPDQVPEGKKRIARALFGQFKHVLRESPGQDEYPPMPDPAALAAPAEGIQEYFDIEGVRFIMLDGRTWREPDVAPGYHGGTMLGESQRQWLRQAAGDWAGLKVICSGSTLMRGGESWDKFRDLEWLMDQRFENALVLSGDIHRNARSIHEHKGYRLPEYTSSGAARPRLGGDSGNYGILETFAGGYTVNLCKFERVEIPHDLPPV